MQRVSSRGILPLKSRMGIAVTQQSVAGKRRGGKSGVKGGGGGEHCSQVKRSFAVVQLFISSLASIRQSLLPLFSCNTYTYVYVYTHTHTQYIYIYIFP